MECDEEVDTYQTAAFREMILRQLRAVPAGILRVAGDEQWERARLAAEDGADLGVHVQFERASVRVTLSIRRDGREPEVVYMDTIDAEGAA